MQINTDVECAEPDQSSVWHFTGFYGAPYVSGREDTWGVLRSLRHSNHLLWLACGDFNEILYASKKKGGLPRNEQRMEAFRLALQDCQLFDIGYSSPWFTWERGNLPETNIRECLDKGVANNDMLLLFLDLKVRHLPHIHSDHCPLLVTLDECLVPIIGDFALKHGGFWRAHLRKKYEGYGRLLMVRS